MVKFIALKISKLITGKMKVNKIHLTCLVVLLLLFTNKAFSQMERRELNVRFSIPEIAIVDIEPGLRSIEFSILPSAEPGGYPVVRQSGKKLLWINYSSALNKFNSSRSIVAQISQGVLPDGISLSLEASQYNGSGRGQLGVSTGKTNITIEPRVIITNIGSCFTGNGINNGHSLNFSVNITDLSKISAIETTELTIRYTISDN